MNGDEGLVSLKAANKNITTYKPSHTEMPRLQQPCQYLGIVPTLVQPCHKFDELEG